MNVDIEQRKFGCSTKLGPFNRLISRSKSIGTSRMNCTVSGCICVSMEAFFKARGVFV